MWEFSREQAHIPAEQSASQPYPWLSFADADPRRPRHHFRPAPQGPGPPVGLTCVQGVAAIAENAQLERFPADDQARASSESAHADRSCHPRS
jgi:hypothetical protein